MKTHGISVHDLKENVTKNKIEPKIGQEMPYVSTADPTFSKKQISLRFRNNASAKQRSQPVMTGKISASGISIANLVTQQSTGITP